MIIHHLLHHIGLHHHPAIRKRRIGLQHLQRRNLYFVPNRHPRQRHTTPLIRLLQSSRHLVRQVHMRDCTKPHIPGVLIKCIRINPLRNFRENDIRRFGDRIPERQPAQWIMIPHPLPIDHRTTIVRRIKPLLRIHQILLQCRQRSHQLKRRSRLYHIGNRPVPPKLRFCRCRIVRMKIRNIRHRQNPSRRRLHHNRGPRFCPKLLHTQHQLLLHNRLKMRIDRCHQRVPHPWRLLWRTYIRKNPVRPIPPHLLHPILPTKYLIIKCLQPRHPGHLMIHIPQHMRRQISKVIPSLVLLLHDQ